MENSGKWKVEKSLYNNPKIAIEKGEKMNTYIISERTHKGTWITFDS